MPLLDRVVSGVVLGTGASMLALRALRAWREARVQRRAIDLLTRTVTELERPARERRP
jgi:hypothetical protein